MFNIKLNYRYRDYANYKNYGEAVFANPDNLPLTEIEAALRATCMDDGYFLASRWALSDLHFDKWDDEDDHAWHEFQGLEFTDEVVTEGITISELLVRVMGFKDCYS